MHRHTRKIKEKKREKWKERKCRQTGRAGQVITHHTLRGTPDSYILALSFFLSFFISPFLSLFLSFFRSLFISFFLPFSFFSCRNIQRTANSGGVHLTRRGWLHQHIPTTYIHRQKLLHRKKSPFLLSPFAASSSCKHLWWLRGGEGEGTTSFKSHPLLHM